MFQLYKKWKFSCIPT